MFKSNFLKTFGLIAGPLLFLFFKYWYHPTGLSAQGIAVLASACWIALWWMTEAIEVEVTALLPIVLFPLSGGLDLISTCTAYGHKFIFLFIGGFTLALTIQKWNLHKRIALNIIHFVGTNPKKVMLGFMISTSFLSMWISNTATTVMMLPIGLAVAGEFGDKVEGRNWFATALLLSIAYSASIGGIATLIGTPPNLILAGVIEQSYGIELSFTKWLIIGLPISIVLLFGCWYYLCRTVLSNHRGIHEGSADHIRQQLKELGPLRFEEKLVALVFIITALLWITRSMLLEQLIPALDDPIIAIAASVVLFLLPASGKKQQLLEWKDAVKLPWGILILFGGGISLAIAFQDSGLANWIAVQMNGLENLPLLLIVFAIVALVNFLTEVSSNIATTSVFLPVLVPLALALNVHPFGLMIAATLAASCAYMLPVATPPNAIVFSSDQVGLMDMMKAGFWMNIFSIALIGLFIYFLMGELWEIDLHQFPLQLKPL